MTRAGLRALAAVVYVDEIVATGTDHAWDEYDALLASVPCHDAPISEQRAFAGPELLEPEG